MVGIKIRLPVGFCCVTAENYFSTFSICLRDTPKSSTATNKKRCASLKNCGILCIWMYKSRNSWYYHLHGKFKWIHIRVLHIYNTFILLLKKLFNSYTAAYFDALLMLTLWMHLFRDGKQIRNPTKLYPTEKLLHGQVVRNEYIHSPFYRNQPLHKSGISHLP